MTLQEELQAEMNLPKILKMIPDLVKFQEAYDKVSYLKVLEKSDEHEKFLFDTYRSTFLLLGNSGLPFKDFTKDNLEFLTRLKWRFDN